MNFIEAIAAQNKDLPTVMPLDFFSYLLGKSQASPTKTITGTPPFTFKSNGDNLIDWSIKGNTGGVGDKTKNVVKLLDSDTERDVTFTVDSATGTITMNGDTTQEETNFGRNSSYDITGISGDYVLSGCPDGGSLSTYYLYTYDMTSRSIVSRSFDSSDYNTTTYESDHIYRVYIQVRKGNMFDNIVFRPMIRAAGTSSDFEPYGYKIPISCGGSTTDIFIGDSPLGADVTITKTSTGVDIPTVNGSNTLTVETAVQPSEMTITYHR